MRLIDHSNQQIISGSTVDLVKDLKLPGVMHLLGIFCEAYRDLRASGKVTPDKIEPEINGEFFHYLQMVWFDKGPKSLTPDREKSHGKRIYGRGKTPTIDLCFRGWDSEIYFGAECKILEDKNHRYEYYIDGGVCRYISCDYGPNFPVGAMIGYIITGDTLKIINEVKNRVDKLPNSSKMNISNPINGFKEHYESIHKRLIGVSPFDIHHLFFCFT